MPNRETREAVALEAIAQAREEDVRIAKSRRRAIIGLIISLILVALLSSSTAVTVVFLAHSVIQDKNHQIADLGIANGCRSLWAVKEASAANDAAIAKANQDDAFAVLLQHFLQNSLGLGIPMEDTAARQEQFGNDLENWDQTQQTTHAANEAWVKARDDRVTNTPLCETQPPQGD